ncbi:MAG: hypothetical protein WA789_03045 [Candidatus Acidiferrum sp.]|jgi:hypothetical protein
MQTNIDRFLANQQRYFSGSHNQFLAFGGPCVYFHEQCLVAGAENFLSLRHIEMLYATLTAWGMHRMGDSEKAKTRLTNWVPFHTSLATQTEGLQQFKGLRMSELSESEYSAAILCLKTHYAALKLSVSGATIVVNSKAFHHLFPEFIPPIDRQYTIRFFTQAPEKWLDPSGKFRTVQLPKTLDEQFHLFHSTCVAMKQLANRVDPELLRREREESHVSTPKALDNAIVNYVRITVSQLRRLKPPADLDELS